MTTEVGICNLALSHIGKKAEVTAITPPDGSLEAEQCRTFYPIARDNCLADGEWGFAMRRITLALIGTPPSTWTYQYARPNNCIKPVALLMPDSEKPQKFIQESHPTHGKVILTDIEDATLRYVHRITNSIEFSEKFVIATSWLLASYLAGPLTRSEKKQQAAYDVYESLIAKAAVEDADGEHNPPDHTPGHIAARA